MTTFKQIDIQRLDDQLTHAANHFDSSNRDVRWIPLADVRGLLFAIVIGINPVDDQLSAKIACLPATHAAAHRVGWSSDWISIFDDHAYAATPDGGTRKIRRFYGEPRRLDPAGNAETADFLCCEWRAMTRLHVPEVTADTWYRLNGGCPPVTADMWRRLNGGRR